MCSRPPRRLRNVAAGSIALLLVAGGSSTSALSTQIEYVVGAALVFWFVDPLGPNWEVAERRISPTVVHLSLRKKRIAIGGDGEPPHIVRRRATELALEAGVRGYQILEYSESIESETIGTRRVATALVKLTDARPVLIP